LAAKYSIPRGTFDILPENSYKWEYLKTTFKKVCETFCFKEITTPIFEKAELFERSSGESSDIVQKEMYKFTDKKGRVFALRPEGTAPVVRSFVENNLDKSSPVNKLFYYGPMFRYDRPQKGRYRQFYQFGAENFGSKTPYSDAEMIAMAYSFIKKLGLKNIRLEINSLGTKSSMENYDQALKEYFTPHFDDLCPDCQKRLEKNPKRLLDCKVKSCKQIAKDAPNLLEYLSDEDAKHFEEVQKFLKLMNVPFVINPKIVRGLDYYTNTVFEFLNDNLGAQNAIIAGGRYNNLVSEVGGNNIPAIGFAGGFSRLLLSLEIENLFMGEQSKPDIYFAAIGQEVKESATKIIQELRINGFKVEFDFEKGSLKSQLKSANKLKTRFVAIYGEDEIQKKSLVIKDFFDSSQEEILVKDVINYFSKKIS